MAPVLRLPGMKSVTNITDLWWSPLLSDKWAPLALGYAFSAHPFEVILLGTHGPRHDRVGLAVFNVSLDGPRTLPMMMEYKAPLIELEASAGITVDMLTDSLPPFVKAMQDPILGDVVCRHHRRSPLSTPELPRVCIDLLFPVDQTELTQLLQLRHL